MNKFYKFSKKFSSLATWLMIIAIVLGFTGGAAMALDEKVTHQTIGMVAFVMSLSLAFLWIVSGIVSAYVKTYKEARGTDLGSSIEFMVKLVLALTSLIITIVALIIH